MAYLAYLRPEVRCHVRIVAELAEIPWPSYSQKLLSQIHTEIDIDLAREWTRAHGRQQGDHQ